MPDVAMLGVSDFVAEDCVNFIEGEVPREDGR